MTAERRRWCICSRATRNLGQARSECFLHGDTAEAKAYQDGLHDAAHTDGLAARVEALRPILDRIAENEEHVSFIGGPEQAARFVASVAWPLERQENRDSWAPRLLAEEDMLNQEAWRARARLQAAIDTCRAARAGQPVEPPC